MSGIKGCFVEWKHLSRKVIHDMNVSFVNGCGTTRSVQQHKNDKCVERKIPRG